MYSKGELYAYKANPKRPLILTRKLPWEGKPSYSFFLGSNFIASGERMGIRLPGIRFPSGICFSSIDTSAGVLKVDVLAGLDENDEPDYLIRENELMVDTQDVWDMRYTGPSLKIWRTANDGKRVKFIDLSIYSDVIIIKRMNTSFNGKPFRVFKWRSPQRRQVDKIKSKVKEYEERYREMAAEIDSRIDVAAHVRQAQKDRLKTGMKEDLERGLYRNFNKRTWPYPYYLWVLDGVLMESPIFRRERKITDPLVEFKERHEMVVSIKAKYQKEFEDLSAVVVQYGGLILEGNVFA